MKSIDRALIKYLTGAGSKVSVQEISIYATKHGDDLIDTLFSILNKELDNYLGDKSLEKLHDAFHYMNVILANAEELNRKYLVKRLNKLSNKLDRIEAERKGVFKNPEKVHEEFSKLAEKIEELREAADKEDNKQFDFMNYLMTESQNIAYVEFTLKKLPHLVNIKDKNGKSISKPDKILKNDFKKRKEAEPYRHTSEQKQRQWNQGGCGNCGKDAGCQLAAAEAFPEAFM